LLQGADEPELAFMQDASVLEGSVWDDYRAWISSPDEGMLRSGAGLKFRQSFWQPIAEKLGDAHRVFISPDGILQMASLGVVPAGGGLLLMDCYDIRFVISTKDILRLTTEAGGKTAVLLGNPDYALSVADQEKAVNIIEERRKAAISTGLNHRTSVTAPRRGSPFKGVRPHEDCSNGRRGATLCPLPETE